MRRGARLSNPFDSAPRAALSSLPMAATPPEPRTPPPEERAASAARSELVAEAAGGAGVVFAAELVGRAARLATTWYLSGALGAALFGRWSSATTLLLVLGAPLPLGTDLGMVYFGARHLGRGERAAWKGTLRTGAVVAAGGSLVGGLLLWGVCRFWLAGARPELAGDLARIVPAIAAYGLLLFLVGVLRAHRAMVAQAISYQVVLPLGTLLGAALAARLGLGLPGVFGALTLATLGAATLVAWQGWRRTRGLWRDRDLVGPWAPRRLLRWCLPQSLETTLFRANQWMDVLMLTALAAPLVVGSYRVVLALALLCQVPVMALVTVLNPMVAALVGQGERRRLEGLVRAATRWLIVLVAPLALTLVLVPDLALAVFDKAYQQGADSLRLLVPGVALFAVSAPTQRLIPMSGHARLNLLDHLGAAILNAGLNLWLIPRFGMHGAALATTISLSLWSLVSILQVRHLLGCSAWDRRNLALGGTAFGLGALGLVLGAAAPLGWRLALLGACGLAFIASLRLLGLAAEDRHILGLLRARLARAVAPDGSFHD